MNVLTWVTQKKVSGKIEGKKLKAGNEIMERKITYLKKSYIPLTK